MRYNVLFLPLFILCSCDIKNISDDELKTYVLDPENGLRKSIKKEDVTVDLLYRPKELIILQETDGANENYWNEVKERLDSMDYFILRLSRNGNAIENQYVADPIKFAEVTNYLSNSIREDVKLISDGKQIAAEAIAYTPSFGTSGQSSVLLIFKSAIEKRNGTVSITYSGSMFGIGYTEFEFDCDDIKKIPRLKNKFKSM